MENAIRILLVEDEPDLAMAVQVRLETQGYQISVVHDGQSALEKARAEKPDLIILDIMLPKMDGYKVCRMLKFDDQYKHIPIMMFSARVQDKDIEIAQECGADEYITKPFEPQLFLSKVRELLSKAGRTTKEDLKI